MVKVDIQNNNGLSTYRIFYYYLPNRTHTYIPKYISKLAHTCFISEKKSTNSYIHIALGGQVIGTYKELGRF